MTLFGRRIAAKGTVMLPMIRFALVAVMLLACGCSKPVERPMLNREDRRLVEIVHPYFYDTEGVTNFIDMTKAEKLATINSLREKTQTGSKLLFFEVGDSGQFISIDRTDDIDAQLASCALKPEEIALVKREARAGATPGRPESHEWNPPREYGKRNTIPGTSAISASSHLLNSSQYDVSFVAHGRLYNKDGQELYRGAFCLILSPTALR